MGLMDFNSMASRGAFAQGAQQQADDATRLKSMQIANEQSARQGRQAQQEEDYRNAALKAAQGAQYPTQEQPPQQAGGYASPAGQATVPQGDAGYGAPSTPPVSGTPQPVDRSGWGPAANKIVSDQERFATLKKTGTAVPWNVPDFTEEKQSLAKGIPEQQDALKGKMDAAMAQRFSGTKGRYSSPEVAKAQFIQLYGPYARMAGDKLGVDPNMILAQWGLETGWGNSIIPDSNNLGNIKSGAQQGGATAKDNQTGTVDWYRRYATPEDFVEDYIAQMQRNWGGVAGAGGDINKFAAGLTNGRLGAYATDPAYATKLAAAYSSLSGGQPSSGAAPSLAAAGAAPGVQSTVPAAPTQQPVAAAAYQPVPQASGQAPTMQGGQYSLAAAGPNYNTEAQYNAPMLKALQFQAMHDPNPANRMDAMVKLKGMALESQDLQLRYAYQNAMNGDQNAINQLLGAYGTTMVGGHRLALAQTNQQGVFQVIRDDGQPVPGMYGPPQALIAKMHGDMSNVIRQAQIGLSMKQSGAYAEEHGKSMGGLEAELAKGRQQGEYRLAGINTETQAALDRAIVESNAHVTSAEIGSLKWNPNGDGSFTTTTRRGETLYATKDPRTGKMVVDSLGYSSAGLPSGRGNVVGMTQNIKTSG